MLKGIMTTLSLLYMSEEERRENYRRRKVGRDIVGGFIVSTVFVDDLEVFETAIIHDGPVVPVERYNTKEEAKNGHLRWCSFCEAADGKEIEQLGYAPWDWTGKVKLKAPPDNNTNKA